MRIRITIFPESRKRRRTFTNTACGPYFGAKATADTDCRLSVRAIGTEHNIVGEHGKGESVWLGFFFFEVLTEFTAIAQMMDDRAFAEHCRSEAAALRQKIEQGGWDGGWYRRAYFDDGTPLGSVGSPECQIDSIAQSCCFVRGRGHRTLAACPRGSGR